MTRPTLAELLAADAARRRFRARVVAERAAQGLETPPTDPAVLARLVDILDRCSRPTNASNPTGVGIVTGVSPVSLDYPSDVGIISDASGGTP